MARDIPAYIIVNCFNLACFMAFGNPLFLMSAFIGALALAYAVRDEIEWWDEYRERRLSYTDNK